jgi:hypothetical protein
MQRSPLIDLVVLRVLAVLVLLGSAMLPVTVVAQSLIGSAPPALPSNLPGRTPVMLSAIIEGTTETLSRGISWRVYDAPTDRQATLVQKSERAAPSFMLEPGAYIVHVTFGLASATRRIVVAREPVNERLMIAAGGLRLFASVSDNPIPPSRVRFNIYVPVGNDPEGRTVAENVREGTIIRLPEGQYRVTSYYGSTNAVSSADLRVESGKLSEATIKHRAATVTLKLVLAPGAEALAGTTFSVLTPGGDIVREVAGAFPSMTLAEGDYVLVARHAGKVYSSEFKVKTGLDGDVEVLAR